MASRDSVVVFVFRVQKPRFQARISVSHETEQTSLKLFLTVTGRFQRTKNGFLDVRISSTVAIAKVDLVFPTYDGLRWIRY